MIAKLIVHAETRALAIARMEAALSQYEVIGVKTNIDLLARLMTAPSFVEGRLDTALIEREHAHLFPEDAEPPTLSWQLAVLAFVLAQRAAPGSSPWSRQSGWRVATTGRRRWKFRCAQTTLDVAVALSEDTVLLETGGHTVTLTGALECGSLQATIDGTSLTARAQVIGNTVHLFSPDGHRMFEWLDPYLPPAQIIDRHGGMIAPMPGRVIAVHAQEGARVVRGAPLIVLEAMKMEHTMKAPSDGTIARIFCKVGEQVKEGAELMTLEEAR
jgi:3-methylcrotonyl-CoA carboxylase alpha subunit